MPHTKKIINVQKKWGSRDFTLRGERTTLRNLTKRFRKTALWSSFGIPRYLPPSPNITCLDPDTTTHPSARPARVAPKECRAEGGKHLTTFEGGLSVQTLPESINTKVFPTCGRNSNIFVCYIFEPLKLEYFVLLHIASLLGWGWERAF